MWPTQLVSEKVENHLEPRNADGPYHSRRIMGQSTQAGDPHQEGGRISQVSSQEGGRISQEGEKVPQEWR